jgi:hypothetical protein
VNLRVQSELLDHQDSVCCQDSDFERLISVVAKGDCVYDCTHYSADVCVRGDRTHEFFRLPERLDFEIAGASRREPGSAAIKFLTDILR